MSELQMTPDEREYWQRMNDPRKVVHIMPSALAFAPYENWQKPIIWKGALTPAEYIADYIAKCARYAKESQ